MNWLRTSSLVGLAALLGAVALLGEPEPGQQTPLGRREVLFWHFWGGADRMTVDRVVERFNRSQQRHFVRAVAMPGNNLDLKLFLAVTGGSPPDLVNQDDPIMADWAERGALTPLDEIATSDELARLNRWLVPAARRLGTYRGRMYGLCNGLDVRALYYNKTVLDEYRMSAPQDLEDLNRIARDTTVRDEQGRYVRFGYLPDPRRLWAWGVVFGGDFYDAQHNRVTANESAVVAALDWMTEFRRVYGTVEIASFRRGDQSLPGKPFPLLAGRYVLLMDGQWRVRDITASQAEQVRRGLPVTQYGVCPLPSPKTGRTDAGWVNGNFFLVPRGAGNTDGAWEFMKFWSGFDGHESEAALTCVQGGWIPVSRRVVDEPKFAEFLNEQPLFAEFVRLAAAEYQVPTPVIPGAPFFQRNIIESAQRAMYEESAPPSQQLLDEATETIQKFLDSR